MSEDVRYISGTSDTPSYLSDAIRDLDQLVGKERGVGYVVLAPHGIVSHHKNFEAALTRVERANAEPRFGMGNHIVRRWDGSKIRSLAAFEQAALNAHLGTI